MAYGAETVVRICFNFPVVKPINKAQQLRHEYVPVVSPVAYDTLDPDSPKFIRVSDVGTEQCITKVKLLTVAVSGDMQARVEAVLRRQYARAAEVLSAHKASLLSLADALVETLAVSGDEVRKHIRAEVKEPHRV